MDSENIYANNIENKKIVNLKFEHRVFTAYKSYFFIKKIS